MKKILAILLAAMMVFVFTACGKTGSEEEPVDTNAVLAALADEGWTATDSGYEKQESSEYCETRYMVCMDGKTMILEIRYDYGKQNQSVQQLFTDNEESATGISAGWFTEIERICEADFDGMRYSLYVGDEKVGEGTMSAAEAREAAAEYDD